MKKELIESLFRQFEQACYEHNGIEYWSARDLQPILGYSRWENFFYVIEKARISCKNSGTAVADHFRDITKSIAVPKGDESQLQDIALTRYACYLIAQNGDTQKDPIAFAQTYFAEQTRSHNVIEKDLTGETSITAEHVDNNTAVRNVSLERGVKPETLPPAENLGKVKRRIDKEDKNALSHDN